jgi:hypothetical protein
MERKLGRYLTKEEVVHHINGVRDDNRIENLWLFPNNKHHSSYERYAKLTYKKWLKAEKQVDSLIKELHDLQSRQKSQDGQTENQGKGTVKQGDCNPKSRGFHHQGNRKGAKNRTA